MVAMHESASLDGQQSATQQAPSTARGPSNASHIEPSSLKASPRNSIALHQAGRTVVPAALAWQRSAGNRAVAHLITSSRGPRALLVQRLLHLPSFQNVEDQKQQLGAVQEAANSYNEGAKQGPAESLAKLRAVERSVYTWFNGFARHPVNEVPNANALLAFLKQAEAEYTQIIANNSLAASPGDGLWNDIVRGQGSIIIEGDEGFRNQMLAAIHRILSKPFGRDLIKRLAYSPGEYGGIVIAADLSARMRQAPIPEPQGSAAVPMSDLHKETENASKMRGAGHSGSSHQIPDPLRLHTLLTTGSGNRVDIGASSYERGAPSGSLVKIASGGGFVLGRDLNPALMPAYVTLGHELGHALRLLHGAPLNDADWADIGVVDRVEQALWNNPEEYVNILAVENSLREEHGLAPRTYHAGELKSVFHERRKFKFEERLFGRVNRARNPDLLQTTPQAIRLQEMNVVHPDFGDDSVWGGIKKQLQGLKRLAKLDDNNLVSAAIADQEVERDAGLLADMIRLGKEKHSVMDAIVYACRLQSRWSVIARLWAKFPPGYLVSAVTAREYLFEIDPARKRLSEVLTNLLQASRQGGQWALVAEFVKLVPSEVFAAGLEPAEFESNVDPEGNIPVEVQYQPVSGRYKGAIVTYVRKQM